MSGKAAKKLRQMYNRDLRQEIERAHEDIEALIKRPPRWFPARLWFWLQSLFLNV